MAADLSIHVLGPYKYKSWETGNVEDGEATEQDYKDLEASSLGSKYFSSGRHQGAWDRAFHNLGNSPQVWIGEVSWLKAAFLEDAESFIPGPVQRVAEVIGEDFPVIDDGLIEKIAEAMRVENATSYRIATENEVVDFLKEHKGKKVVTVSW